MEGNNTITRAELAGLEAATYHPALQHPQQHQLTDSASSLWQVHRALFRPYTLTFHPHRLMIQHITKGLLDRIQLGHNFLIGKVKAHIGVRGNEKADRLAKKAAEGKSLNYLSPMQDQPFHSLWWPHRCRTDSEIWQPQYPLKQCKRRSMGSMHGSRPKGIYQQAWEGLAMHMEPGSKAYIHAGSIPGAWRKAVMKFWNGCLYNQKIAFRLGHSMTDKCPLCGQPDSAGHMLGECKGHPHITGLRIQRHHSTVGRLAALLQHSDNPAVRRACLIVDGGKEANQDSDLGCRIPEWILPSVAENDRLKMRPDILCITAPEKHVPILNGLHDKQALKDYGRVHILEVGYHGDTFYLENRQRKLQQHTQLCKELDKEGWTVVPPDPILFGHGGTTYQEVRHTLHHKYQIPNTHINSFMKKTQRQAAHKVFQLVQARRTIERKQDS
jgi:hypothetical protein